MSRAADFKARGFLGSNPRLEPPVVSDGPDWSGFDWDGFDWDGFDWDGFVWSGFVSSFAATFCGLYPGG